MNPEFIIRNPELLAWMLLLVPFVFFRVYQIRKANRDLHEFTPSTQLKSSMTKRQVLKLVLASLAMSFAIFSLARPASNPHPEYLYKKGRDLTFILDVSNSMLAEDLLPNRLERAKMYIQDCVASLENHRVALVVFAGSASIKSPLTNDVDFFLEALDSAGPSSVAHGGTRISDAILKTVDKIFSKDSEAQNIILLSDGGNQAKNLETTIEALNKKGIKLICIGLGDEVRGSRIPDPDRPGQFLREEIKTDEGLVEQFSEAPKKVFGREIWTKLESAKMNDLVDSVKGAVYIAAGTKDLNLDEVYRDLQRMSPARHKSEHMNIVYDDQFHTFLGIAFVLFVLSIVIPDKKESRKNALAVSLMVLLLCSFGNQEIDKRRLALQDKPTVQGYADLARDCFEAERYDLSSEFYRQALKLSLVKEERLFLTYNLAVTLHYDARLGKKSEFAALEEDKEGLPDDFSPGRRTSIEKLELINKAIALYRLLILENREPELIQNLYSSVKYRQELIQLIKVEQKFQQEFALAIQKMRELISKALDEQKGSLKHLGQQLKKELPMDLKSLDALQKKTELSTKAASKQSEEYLKSFKGHMEATGLFELLNQHFFTSLAAQKDFLLKDDYLKKDSLARSSKLELERALSVLDMNAQESESNEGKSDSADEEESDNEENSDEDSESEDSKNSDSSELEEGLDQNEIPPPQDNPEDLIKREKQLQKSRMQKQKELGGKKSKQGVTW